MLIPTRLPLLLLATAAAAQDPFALPHQERLTAPQPAGHYRAPVHTRAIGPDEPAYGLWAAGDAYKVSFHDGMRFVPVLGRNYPHNQPFAWRTTSVRVGTKELLTGAAPTLTHTDWRVEYAHGAVVEAYDVRAEGLEQSFVFAERPAGTGDLCIRGTTTSALWTPAVEGTVGDLVFRDAEGRPILTYGTAVAIDADGDRFPVTTTCVGNQISLRLAAADLARADFPLVVDPLMAGNTAIGLGPIDHLGDVDVATEAEAGHTYNTVYGYVTWVSATDADVDFRIAPMGGLNGSILFGDYSDFTACDHPRAAYVHGADRWVLVYQQLTLATSRMVVRAAVAIADSTTMATSIAAALPGSGSSVHDWRPVVGGTDPNGLNGGPTTALVVCQRESGTAAFANTADSAVVGVLFQPLAAAPWGTPFNIQDSATVDFERPAINRAAEGALAWSWFVVYQAYDNAIVGDDWDLIGRLVTNNGVVSANSWTSSLGTMHKLGPVVDGRHGRFCVSFATAATTLGKTQNIVGTQLCCERLDWAHAAATPSAAGDYPAETLASNTYNLLEATGIAYDGNSRSHWALAYRLSATLPALYATRVGYQGKPVQAADTVYYNSQYEPGVGSVAHNDRASRTLVVYELDAPSTAVWWREFVLPTSQGPAAYGTGCTAAQLTWGGPLGSQHERWIGSQFAGPEVAGAVANAAHLCVLGGTSMNAPISLSILGANCSLLVPPNGAGHIGMFPIAVGSSVQWQLPLPESLPSMTVYLQDWILDPNDGLLRGTHGLRVDLVR